MTNRLIRAVVVCLPFVLGSSGIVSAAVIQGTVRDTSGQVLAGVTIEVTGARERAVVAVTDSKGQYSAAVSEGAHQVRFKLINFATIRRAVDARDSAPTALDVTLPLETSASIVVTGKKTFRNLADLDTPINGMIGIADAASVGVITAKQIEARE